MLKAIHNIALSLNRRMRLVSGGMDAARRYLSFKAPWRKGSSSVSANPGPITSYYEIAAQGTDPVGGKGEVAGGILDQIDKPRGLMTVRVYTRANPTDERRQQSLHIARFGD
jgi:hypothetical protein